MKYILSFLLCLPLTSVLHAQSWIPAESITNQNLYTVYFTDKHFGWAAGENGTIIHTSDGGQSWTHQQSRTSETLHDIHFFDEFTGWISGNENTLLHTNDGGQTWSDRRPSSVPGQNLNAVTFIDWKRGWTAGGPGNFIYFTDDAGLTWQRQHSDESENSILSLKFTNHSEGLANNSNQIFRTENSGHSWDMVNFTVQNLPSVSLLDLTLFDDASGVAVASQQNSGLILYTADDETQWEVRNRLPEQKLFSGFFTDSMNGWVPGENGLILKIDENSEILNQFDLNSSAHIFDIHFPDDETGWAVGSNGKMFTYRIDSALEAPPFTFNYPSFRFNDENETVELLNRVLFYLENADEFEHPEDRKPFFKRIRGAISQVDNYFSETEIPEAISDRMFEIITSTWAQEHNSGADIFNETTQENGTSELLHRSANHFINAIILQPDSSQSYKTLAYVFEDLGRIDEAIQTFRMGLDKINTPDSEDYDYLLNLYLLESRAEEAYHLAKKASIQYPDHIYFKEFMADYYAENNQPAEAVSILEELTHISPETHRYYITKATLNYQIAFDYLQESVQKYEQLWRLRERTYGDISAAEERRLTNQIGQILDDIDKLEVIGSGRITLIISNLEQVLESAPDHEQAHLLIAQLSRSRAAFYIEKSTLTHESAEITELEQQAVSDLQKALTHYEHLVQLQPENREYLEALYRVYTQLGMQDRASEIRNRF